MDDDIGMNDVEDGAGKRRGRPGARSTPMGTRPPNKVDGKPYDPRARGPARNGPGAIRDDTRASGSPKTTVPTSIETIRVFLSSRYSPDAKLLNLENMANDTVLNAAGVNPPGHKRAAKDISGVVWKLAGQMFPDIVSLSLANNSLTSLLPLSPFLLTTYLPNLQNVSFASNSLSQLRDLDPLSPSIGKARRDNQAKGWAALKELVMTGNPMVETGAREGLYRREIARRFPSLQQLDQQPIDPAAIAFEASAVASTSNLTPGLSSASKRDNAKAKREPIVFPVPVKGGFFEAEDTRDFVAGFFMKFFPAFDSERPSLLPAYAPTCSFSFFVDTAYPLRSKAKKIGGHGDKKFPHQHQLDWKMYLTAEGSRNLARVKNSAKRVATLQVTPSAVITSVMSLPKTIHPLSDPEKFVFDTWTMPGLLAPTAPGVAGETVIYAVVHGQFMELPSKGVRSFDRTFILAPSPPGSPAQLAGWPCMVLSDILTVRGYSDPSVWTPKVVPPPAAAVAPVPGAPVAPAPTGEGLTAEQQAVIMELAQHTNLTLHFAQLCLVENGWNAAAALANFQALHASGAIPPEAFRPV